MERLFAKLKKWKFLRYEHDIHFDPEKIHEIFECICSFHNEFGSPLYRDYSRQNEDVQRILDTECDVNDIEEHEAKEASGWKGQKVSDLMVLDDRDIIPDFDISALRKLCCGSYQMQLAIPYYRHSNNIKFMRHDNWPKSLRTDGIVSRHSRNDVNKTQYRVYHRFMRSGLFEETLSFCSCAVGKRTVCLCAHMSASLYVLYHRMRGMDIPEHHPLTTKHMSSMIDLFHWKYEYKQLQEGGASNNRPILDRNNNAILEDMDMDMMYGAGIGDIGLSEVAQNDGSSDDSVHSEDDESSLLFDVDLSESDEDESDVDHDHGLSFEVGMVGNNNNMNEVEELQHDEDEKAEQLSDNEVVLTMTPRGPSNGDVRRNRRRRRRGRIGGDRAAKRQKM